MDLDQFYRVRHSQSDRSLNSLDRILSDYIKLQISDSDGLRRPVVMRTYLIIVLVKVQREHMYVPNYTNVTLSHFEEPLES